ncbi:DUF86 domain-containing protein [Shewanella eurypsychrophilus]|uniref:DUF86 domain-containing protein n=1 Tax=Shewanella eurypsychrophilus TaxID=2593656 RepID=A0ABX6V8A3_9GAMM|nr:MULTISPECIES: DUF86 domain-containing protein [Shewanella]QFU23427.1 DUF86 domain-containing protein [Shewanella sp. YLB-09]QPG58655.1 DUF86 domain-containing protein [Shewanella eurypsychrophilus]
MNDITINKLTTIRRCLTRIKDVYGDGSSFPHDYTLQDSVLLNLQRACEASIDIANHISRQHKFGVPQSSRDSFTLLAQNDVIPVALADKLKKMVGLRNIAVHDYQELNLDIVIHVIKHNLKDFEDFIDAIQPV